ncbi:MAG: hypothetical protein KGL22_06280, partial [Alphaproteobacteria bacterium]|nr:hypothetical protein [Alphaproteobacteria bacterium]
LAVLSLFFFGGQVLHGFSIAMLWGIVVGTYSSLFIAAPMLYYIRPKGVHGRGGEPAPSPSATPDASSNPPPGAKTGAS